MEIKKRIKKHNRICDLLTKFLDLLQHSLCGYCSGKGHHLGHFLRRMNGKKIPISDIRKWIDDPEHGLFHGMCTAVWALCYFNLEVTGHYDSKSYRKDLNNNIESVHNQRAAMILASSIFHDFAKTLPDQENHDAVLRSYFEDLADGTYLHANPRKIDPLVRADRFELSRFDDWRDWVEKGKLDRKLIPYLDVFGPVRECLRRLSFWEGPWIQHGHEGSGPWPGVRSKDERPSAEEWDQSEVWPLCGSYMNSDRTGGWAAEVMFDPFAECQAHYKETTGRLPDFRRLVGMTTCSRVKKIQPFTRRDHLAGWKESEIDNWIFYYNKRPTRLVKAWIRRGLPILPYPIMKKWDTVRKKLIAMFIAERAEWSDES